MPSLCDPKALTDTLELDYVDRPRPLGLWLRRGIWSAGGLALLCVAWMLWPIHHTALQAGPLSTPHAIFNQDCAKCHTEAFATATRLMPGEHGYYSTPDRACLQCHPAPDHNPDVKVEKCASCHKEHRGHQLLARSSDLLCTNCHATLKETFGHLRQFENVASFAAHPEFALWRNKVADPGTVEFNHKKHLQLRVEDNLTPIKSEVAILQQQKCAYCHQPDAAGKYMQPI
jgi:predicted CXXCH cytochrome family protein